MNNICIGIDFGTTNTVISIYENGKSIIFKDNIFNTIPSKIAYYNNKIYCGNYIPINCEKYISNFKLIDDINLKFILDNEYNYLDLYYIFFKHLYYLISNKYNIKNINTVITVPSDFNYIKRENIKKCFEKVGFIVLRLINEPTSAAFAYGLYNNYNDNNKILVIDIGGGTTDLTILEKCDSFYEVIYSDGINDLGGNNFTQLIIDDILKLLSNNNNIFNISQNIKEKLSILDFYENKDINYSLSRDKFNILCSNLIDKLKNTLNILNNNYNIDDIILVGGTSKIPIIQETIKSIFNKNIKMYPNLESVVAEGAAFYCNIIYNKCNDSIILADIIPFSIGIELADTSYSVIIPKNTTLPIKISQKYTIDNINNIIDNTINIKIYQGERKIANKNNLISNIIFNKISLNCIPVIDITIKVDLNFMITITIIDRKSGYEKNIIINDNIINNKYYENIDNVIINNIDDDELIKNQNIYLIKNYITILFENISTNNLIPDSDKNNIINKFKLIENSINCINNLQLINILNDLQNNYSLIIEPNINNDLNINHDFNTNNYLNIENNKEFIINKINDLLNKYPKYKDILNNILDKLKIDNISNDYIIEQERFINELETDLSKNYKEELNYLCLYIKNLILNNELNNTQNNNELNNTQNNELNQIKLNNKLINLIDCTLEKLSNNITIYNWKEELQFFNLQCEQLTFN